MLRHQGPFVSSEMIECNNCQGSGSIYSEKDKCKKCKGKKTAKERKMLELYIPRGSKYILSFIFQYCLLISISRDGDKIVLQGEADQSPDQEPGDIVFVLEEKEHHIFKRSGADLKAGFKVTLAEALCGFSRTVIKHLDGRGLHMNHKKPQGGVLKPMQVIKIPNEGMPIKKSDRKGDLYLTVAIKFPEDDWLQDEKVTSKLQELLPKPGYPIKADTVDEVEYNAEADLDDFGSTDRGHGDSAWEDEDDDGEEGPQCAQQ